MLDKWRERVFLEGEKKEGEERRRGREAEPKLETEMIERIEDG